MTRKELEDFLALQGNDSLRNRIEWLAAKSNEGELSSDELAEYELCSKANKLLAILLAKARTTLEELPPDEDEQGS